MYLNNMNFNDVAQIIQSTIIFAYTGVISYVIFHINKYRFHDVSELDERIYDIKGVKVWLLLEVMYFFS